MVLLYHLNEAEVGVIPLSLFEGNREGHCQYSCTHLAENMVFLNNS